MFDPLCLTLDVRFLFDPQVFTLPQMESMVIIPGDAGRMSEMVGCRRNLHHSGTTAGTSIQECNKSDLKTVPLVATADKHAMLGPARVKDDSRSTSSAKGPSLRNVILLST